MQIPVVDEALATCINHADTVDADDAVRSLLVDGLLVLIHREFEKAIKGMVHERCAGVADEAVKSYADSFTDRVALRSLRVSDMTALLGRFGEEHKSRFQRLLRQNRQVQEHLDSIIANRNKAAHGAGSLASVSDICVYYEAGHRVLDFFRESLAV